MKLSFIVTLLASAIASGTGFTDNELGDMKSLSERK